jgi:subtilisin family serine protease
MGIDPMGKMRVAMLAALLALPPAPALSQMATNGGPTTGDGPTTGSTTPGRGDVPDRGSYPSGGMPGMGSYPGGDMPGMGSYPGGDMPGTGGYPGGDRPGGDEPGGYGSGGLGPGGFSSDPMRMRQQIEDLNRRRGTPAAPYGSTADAGEQYIPDEVVFALPRSTSAEEIAALLKLNNIYLVEKLDSELGDVVYVRARILNQRAPLAVASAITGDPRVVLAQPNFVFRLQRAPAAPADSSASPPLQYALARLRLPQAHGVARGDEVLVGMIDSAVDRNHPDLDGSIAGVFDATGGPPAAHPHGTAIASLIVGHGRLVGSAPAARLLVARAFDSSNSKGSSFTVLKSLDWLAGHGARIINMSFAGPADPAIRRSLNGAWTRNIILVAAAGNAGPNSPPLYPGAEPKVIAVTATDSGDRLFAKANRGSYIAVAAPGVDLFVAAPDGGYALLSGTSFSAAEVSGIAALILQRRPKLTPDALRGQLLASARPVGPGVKIADAYKAVTAGQAAPAAAKPKLRR